MKLIPLIGAAIDTPSPYTYWGKSQEPQGKCRNSVSSFSFGDIGTMHIDRAEVTPEEEPDEEWIDAIYDRDLYRLHRSLRDGNVDVSR